MSSTLKDWTGSIVKSIVVRISILVDILIDFWKDNFKNPYNMFGLIGLFATLSAISRTFSEIVLLNGDLFYLSTICSAFRRASSA